MTSAKCMDCKKSIAVKKEMSFDCPHCGGKSTVVYNDDHQPTKEQMGGISKWYSNLMKRRVWWKPWTWRRKPPLTAYWPLNDGEAQAFNPALALEERLARSEFAPSHIPFDWDGQRWVVTDNDKFRRIIFVDHVTPKSLAQLGFNGDPESITIFPINQEK